MQLLITGGAGFIGSNLSSHALAQGDKVRVLDDFSTGCRSNLEGLEVDLVEGTLLDSDLLAQTMRGVDAVVHLGAIPSVPRSVAQPHPSHDANATGTLNVLDAARQADVRHISVASSSSVYGANPKLPKSEFDFTRPMSPYAVSKLAAEGYALAFQHSYGLQTIAFRLFNVYGPGQAADHAYAAVVPKFLNAALHNHHVEIHGDGLQSRDFTFVDTVCSVLHQAAREEVTSLDPVNLAFQTNTTLLDLLELMEAELGTGIKRKHIDPRVGDVRASQADCSHITELFPGIKPTPLPDGLKATIKWMEQL